jgi:hypothetical protein
MIPNLWVNEVCSFRKIEAKMTVTTENADDMGATRAESATDNP